MQLVSNSSPLIAFSKLDGCRLLTRLWTTLLIPEAVYRETVLNSPAAPGAVIIAEAINRGSLRVASVATHPLAQRLKSSLDDGEAEAIALASTIPDSLLLIEDGDGRAAAAHLHIRYMGNLGVLAVAKQRGIIPQVRPWLEQLLDAGIFYSEAVQRKFLAGQGE